MLKIYLASSNLRILLFGRSFFSFFLFCFIQFKLQAQTTELVYRINSGGGQTTNSIGVFAADNYFLPTPGYTTSTTKAIASTSNDAIYQNQRGSTNNGTFTYNFPVSNAQYRVKLYLAEIYWTSVGKRVFDVSAEGTKFLDNYDILRKVGPLTATTETFTVNVSDGELNLYLSALISDGGKDRPQISALDIVRITSSSTNQPPVFSAQTYNYSVPETTKTGTSVGTVKASDPNSNDALTYSIVTGNTNKAFSIQASTGVLTLVKPLNFHTQSAYSLKVKVVDPAGSFDEATVAISVNYNTGVPAFTSVTWGTAASQPYTVSEGQGQVVKGKLYTFGGFDSQKSGFTPTKRAYVYDPVTNNWSPIASMPAMNGTNYGGVTHGGFATDGTDIYFAGGYTANSTGTGQIFGTAEVWKYIVAENKYVRLPDLSTKIAAGQLVYLKGKLHYIGGTNSSRTTDLGSHYALDLDNLSAGWKTLAPLPTPRHHAGSAVFAEKIYYLGGQTGHDSKLVTKKEVHEYNLVTNSWTRMADLPVPSGANGRGHISSCVVVMGSRIVVLAGETVHNTGRTNMVSAFSPATNSWQSLTPIPRPRYSGVAAVLGGNLYYTGGSNSSVTYKGVPVMPAQASSGQNVTAISEPKNILSAEESKPALQIFSNPIAQGNTVQVKIINFGRQELVQIQTHDIIGRTVQSTRIKTDVNGAALLDLKMNDQSHKGIFFIKATANSGKAEAKLLVE